MDKPIYLGYAFLKLSELLIHEVFLMNFNFFLER